MKTIITEYKPQGVLRIVGIIASLLFLLHIYILYVYFFLHHEYEFWFFSPQMATVVAVIAPVFIYYLLTRVNVVVNKTRNTLCKSVVVFGIPFNGKRINIGAPEYISLSLQSYWVESDRGMMKRTDTLELNAWNDNTHITLLRYGSKDEARVVGQGIADALGIPFNDNTTEIE